MALFLDSIRVVSAAALLVATLALPACTPDTSCTAEVTEGEGTFKGTASGKRPEPDLKREAVRLACVELCAAGGHAKATACVSRCSVDAEAGKIGARTTCKQAGAR